MSADHHEHLSLALEGFNAAMLRAQESIVNAVGSEPGDADLRLLIPVMESLWWARSADEEFFNEHGAAYTTLREADSSGRLMRGITYARNRGGHQRAIAVVHSGPTWPMRWPVVWDVLLRWRPTHEFPPASSPFHENGKESYEEHLTGERVDSTLDRVMAWFRKADKALGHPLAE